MSFSFTPASYVDPYLDYIRISLDNSLWEGKYWLPYRQEAELRRELPQLDFLGGSVIRGRFEIGGYQLNVELPESILRSARVSAAPEAERIAFPFERPLFAQLEEEGLTSPPSLEEIRQQVREMATDQYLSGLSRLRLHFPTASHALRYNRAEGAFLGAGAVLHPSGGLVLRAHAGYGFASGHFSTSLQLASASSRSGAGLFGYVNELRDLGPLPGTSGVLNTVSAFTAQNDYLDPYFASGVRLALPEWKRALAVAGSVSLEQHRSARLEVSDEDGDFRPVRPVQEGPLLAADLSVGTPVREVGWNLRGELRYGIFDDEQYQTAQLEAGFAREAGWESLNLGSGLRVGWISGRAPTQELFLLGGQGTLLGHPYRAYVGDRFWLADAHASRSLFSPWLSGKVFAAAGWTELDGRALPVGWHGSPDAGVKGSIGVGVGLGWDVLQIDLGRGLGGGGEWGLGVNAARRFRGWL
jgi:hypothetical protein